MYCTVTRFSGSICSKTDASENIYLIYCIEVPRKGCPRIIGWGRLKAVSARTWESTQQTLFFFHNIVISINNPLQLLSLDTSQLLFS